MGEYGYSSERLRDEFMNTQYGVLGETAEQLISNMRKERTIPIFGSDEYGILSCTFSISQETKNIFKKIDLDEEVVVRTRVFVSKGGQYTELKSFYGEHELDIQFLKGYFKINETDKLVKKLTEILGEKEDKSQYEQISEQYRHQLLSNDDYNSKIEDLANKMLRYFSFKKENILIRDFCKKIPDIFIEFCGEKNIKMSNEHCHNLQYLCDSISEELKPSSDPRIIAKKESIIGEIIKSLDFKIDFFDLRTSTYHIMPKLFRTESRYFLLRCARYYTELIYSIPGFKERFGAEEKVQGEERKVYTLGARVAYRTQNF